MPLGPRLAHDELRSLAVAQIACGGLPVMVPSTLNAGYGSGEPCDLCGQPIETQQVVYEVERRPSLALHVVCYSVWQLECLGRLSERSPAANDPTA
jgi:hypothetical protein